MYHFSRAIYRELAPRVIEDARDPTGCRNKQLVLDACEYTIRRLIDDGRYCRRPVRFLFSEIRPYFSLSDQAYAWRVIEVNIRLAREFLLASRRASAPTDNRFAAARRPDEARRASACRGPGGSTAPHTSTSRSSTRAPSSRPRPDEGLDICDEFPQRRRSHSVTR